MKNMYISEYEIVFRLFLACVFGGIVGYERERSDSKAGFRTHILVSLGAALIMILSMYGFRGFETLTKDPARLAAQVVSGIGFLGAGTILRDRNSIKGLTTAASLWVVSAIGLAVGAGFYVSAFAVTFLVFITLERVIEVYFFRTCQSLRIVTLKDGPKIRDINYVLQDHGIVRNNISVVSLQEEENRTIIDYKLRTPFRRLNWVRFVEELDQLGGIESVEKGEDSKSPRPPLFRRKAESSKKFYKSSM